MSSVIKNPRNGCALHGALQTVQEIKGVVPVVHANAGCGVINYLANSNASGGSSKFSGYSIPGTSAQERHVIFGGASRLREQIKNTIKVVSGDLYVILNSCESAMVGDDVDAMTREIVEQGEPVVDTLVAGFNGGTHFGYEHVLADIFKSINDVKHTDDAKNPKLVNVFGIIPGKDPYWQGNLDEIQRILEGFGLEANLIFGANGDAADLSNAKNAALSIVFSRWGELPAKVLNEKYDIPVLLRPSLPVGVEDIKDLANALTEKVSLDEDKVQSFIEREEAYEKNLIYRVRDEIIENGLSKKAILVGDEEQVIRIGRFLKNQVGVEVVGTILTDALKKDEEHETDNEEILKSFSNNVYKTVDQKEINDIIRGSRPEVIFGSSLEREIANKLDVPLVETSYPVFNKLIIGKSNAGVRGLVSIIEDYFTVVREYEYERKLEIEKSLKSINKEIRYEKGDSYGRVKSNKGLYIRKQELGFGNG